MRIESASHTTVGKVRSRNEDAALQRMRPPCFAVADGMGGHAAGDVASSIACSTVGSRSRYPSMFSCEALVLEAHREIRIAANKDRSRHNMGTTLTMLLFGRQEGRARRFHFAHVGDSRLYHLRNGELRLLTKDHALLYSPNILTQALGLEDEPQPDTGEGLAETGDVFLLSTDGVHKQVAEADLRRALVVATTEGHEAIGFAARSLTELADNAGGNDNATAVVVVVR